MTSRSTLRTAIAASILTLLAGCSTSGSALNRELPGLPSYVRRVDTPDPRAGESALIVAARERAAKARANCIIESTSEWYGRVRASYAGRLSPEAIDRGATAACGDTPKKKR